MAGLVAPILLGIVGAAHGVRGEVRVKSYSADPADLCRYGPLTAEDGRRFEVVSLRPARDVVVVRFKGLDDRNAAEALNGVKLFVDRAALPEPDDEDEFLHADLIGLRAETQQGEQLGHVSAIHNFGGGDVIEVRPARGESLLFAFTRAVVPVIDIAGGRIVIAPPHEEEAREE
jgi:16S rRNA processing protein RimM